MARTNVGATATVYDGAAHYEETVSTVEARVGHDVSTTYYNNNKYVTAVTDMGPSTYGNYDQRSTVSARSNSADVERSDVHHNVSTDVYPDGSINSSTNVAYYAVSTHLPADTLLPWE